MSSSEHDNHFGEFQFGPSRIQWNLAPSGLYVVRWNGHMLIMRQGSRPTPFEICLAVDAYEQGLAEGVVTGRAELANDFKRLLGVC